MKLQDVNHFGLLESHIVSDEAKLSQEIVKDLTPFSKLYLTRFILALTVIPTLSITVFSYFFKTSVFHLFVLLSVYFVILIFYIETNFQNTLNTANNVQRFIYNLSKEHNV